MRLIDADALPVHKAYCVDEAGWGANFYVVDKSDIDAAPTIEVKQDPPFSEQELEDLICGCNAQIQEFCISKAEVEPFENLIHKLERMIGDLYGTGKEF